MLLNLPIGQRKKLWNLGHLGSAVLFMYLLTENYMGLHAKQLSFCNDKKYHGELFPFGGLEHWAS